MAGHLSALHPVIFFIILVQAVKLWPYRARASSEESHASASASERAAVAAPRRGVGPSGTPVRSTVKLGPYYRACEAR